MSYYLEDHPNLAVPQYGWPRNRVSGVVGVHTTESGVFPSGGDPGAENTAGFIGRRTDYGSYHALADWDTRIKLVRPTYAAWADTTNNAHALSVSGAMNAARWRDLSPERAAGIVRNMGLAAAELVLDAIAHGVLAAPPPARRITAKQAIDGTAAGFYGHGETNPGTRYDPGQNFDWDLFLATYAAAVGGGINYQGTTTPTEEDMGHVDTISDAAAGKIAQALLGSKWGAAPNAVLGELLNEYRSHNLQILEAVGDVPDAVMNYTVDGVAGDRLNLDQFLREYRSHVMQEQATSAAIVAAKAAAGGASVEEIQKAVHDALASGIKIDATVRVGEQ